MDGESSGTREELTVESAGEKLAGLLSQQSKAAKPVESQPPAKEEPAPTDTEHESEKGEESAEAPEGVSDEKTDEQQEHPELHTVKSNGVEEQVTLEELKAGYSRTKDYTQKTQRTAEETRKASEARQRAEAEETSLREKHQTLAESLKKLETAINDQEPAEPDWEAERRDRPDTYRDLRDSWELYKERKAEVVKQRATAEKQVADDNAKAFESYRQTEDERLLEALPDWKDPEKLKVEAAKIAEHATKVLGFQPEQIRGIVDHRIVLALRKAMLYDEAQKAKPEIKNRIEKPISSAKPGASGKKPNALVESRKRLAESGKMEDAADLLTRALQAQKAGAKR